MWDPGLHLEKKKCTNGKTGEITIKYIVYLIKKKKKTETNMTLLTKVYIIKTMVFPVVMYGCEIRTIKKAECPKN